MLKVTNGSEGRIVLNSLNLILSSNGVLGDSAIIDDDKGSDRDLLSLERAGLLTIEKYTHKKENPQKSKEIVVKDKKPKKRYKSGGPDGDRNRATFVSEGKVKKGRMVQSIEQDGDLPDPLTADDQARAKEDNQGDIFVG